MFARYVQKFKCEKGQPFTHTSIARPKASYYVPSDDFAQFMEEYSAAVAAGEPLFMTERHNDAGPVVLDFDFRFSDIEDVARRYTSEHVRELVASYMRCLETVVVVPQSTQIFVLEKPGARVEKGKLKDGLHVMVPGVVTGPAAQKYVRDRCLPILNSVFAQIGIDNSASDCFDSAVIDRNNWQMYGSSKPDQPPYAVTEVYEWADGELHTAANPPPPENLANLLSIRNKFTLSPFTSESVQQDVEKWGGASRPAARKNVTNLMFHADNSGFEVVRNQARDITLAAKLVDALSPERATSYDSWIRTGWCLRNIDYRLVTKWVDFSKRSPKYTHGECESLWDKMRVNGGLGMGTLKMWVAHDSPDVYKELIREDVFSLIHKSQTGTHYDVACVVHAMYGNDFVCASPKNRTWYQFNQHRWHVCEEAINLSQKISVQVCQEFSQVASVFNQKAALADDDAIQKQSLEISAKLNKVALSLKNTAFKACVMKECMIMFHAPKFEEKLDSKCHLIGFENGVYDLEAMTFREGVPEDFISFSTGINYVPYDSNSEEAQALREYFKQVLPRPGVREYVLLHLASCLNGNIKEERFHVWTGQGSNSKSKLIELFEKSFGDYCCKLPVALLTNKRAQSNAATSEVARTKGRRFAVLQEPSENERFNVGLMKELTGGDKIIARGLFKEPVEFKPQMKLVLTCNHLPEVSADDDGTWRRIRLVEFVSKFCAHPNPNNPYEFPLDMDLSTKMEGWVDVFMGMLLHYYKQYKLNGMAEPDEILKCTREYQRNNDFVSDFVEACTVPAENAFASITDVYAVFKAYLKDGNPDARVPNRKEFQKLLSKAWGGIARGKGGSQGWYGYRVAFDPYGEAGEDGDI